MTPRLSDVHNAISGSGSAFGTTPSHWPVRSIGQIAHVLGGTGFPHDYQGKTEGDYPFYKVSDMNLPGNRQYLSASVNWVSKEVAAELGGTVIPKGSVVFPKVGAALLTNKRRVARVNCLIDNNCMALRFRGGVSEYWVLLLQQVDFGSIVQQGPVPSVNAGQVKHLRVPVPPEDEQRLIADFLDRETHRIDALIDAKRRMIAALLEKREALTLAAVTGGLLGGHATKESSLPWANSVPKHWDEALLNKVGRMGSGHTPSRTHPEWWEDAAIPWITTGEVQQIRDDRIEYVTETREKVSLTGLANSAAVLHPKGTVFLSRTASAGFSGIMGSDMATSQDFVTWICGPRITPRFLLLCLRAMRRDLLARLAQGSTHQTIYMPDIASIKVPLPPIEEQKSIVDRFWRVAPTIDTAVDNLSRQLKLLAEYRQALITQAVTGQLDEATLKGDKPVDEAVGVIPE